MTIELKQNNSDNRVLNKTLTNIITLNGTLKEPSQISKPSIIIDTSNNSIISANYAKIPDFNRYYYIDEITEICDGLCRIDMTCDVLMSFKDYIKASIAIIENTEQIGEERVNAYMSSEAYKATVKTKTDIINFPSGFNDLPYFILITAGGVVS